MILFEAYWERGGSRAGPLFSTSDRALAWDMASVAERAAQWALGQGKVVMLIVNDGVIENDVPDWKHPDFRRPKSPLPIESKEADQ